MYNCQSPSPMGSTAERCPVCRLFLLPDMLLSEHLDTHPKDQVILALTTLVEKQNKNPSRSSSPWLHTPKTTSAQPQYNSIVSETHRTQWMDASDRTPPWSCAPRYPQQTNSPRYTSWPQSIRPHNTTFINELQYEMSPGNNQYNDIPNNQIQFATPVTNRVRPIENYQNLTLATSTPVIQRNDNFHTDVHQVTQPGGVYRSINYIEHDTTYNRQTLGILHNVVNERPCTTQTVHSEKSYNISNNCMNDNSNEANHSTIETTAVNSRKEVIIQPAKSRIDVMPIIQSSTQVNQVNNKVSSQVNSDSYAQHILSNDNNDSIVLTPPKRNIEILSHSVINNIKLIKKPEVKKLMIKQKKPDNFENCDNVHVSNVTQADTESEEQGLSTQKWNGYEKTHSEVKIIENMNNDKSLNDYSDQDGSYSTDQRKTMFSPNLVVINLEESSNKLDSSRTLLDIDAYQQSLDNRSVYEFSKNLNEETFVSTESDGKLYDSSSDFKQETSPNKSSDNTSFQPHTEFEQLDGPLDDFSSHSGSKMNNCDNFRQNLEHSLSSESLNIRTDEKMPARGELSEQESTDSSTWAYQNACSSFPLNLPVDGNELNISQYLSPILEPSSSCSSTVPVEAQSSKSNSSTSKQQNLFKCTHCSEQFLCAKERRVHTSREHSNIESSLVYSKKHTDTLRNSFDSAEDSYEPNISAQNDDLNTYVKDDMKVISQNNCDNFDSSLLVSSMNIINNNTDVVFEPLGKLDVELNSTDIKNDFNMFNLNQSSSESNQVKSEDNFSEQSTSKVKDAVPIKRKRALPRKKVVRFTYTCIVCKAEFSTVCSFNAHLRVHPLECRLCAKLFTRKKTFDLHEQRHLGFKGHVCTQCNKRFFTEQKLQEHEQLHLKGLVFNCNQCDSSFRRKKALSHHRLAAHATKPSGKVFFCHCGENFPSLAKLYYHKETHDTRPKNCKYCTQKFVHLMSLNRHVRIAHNDKVLDDTETCKLCNKNLSKYSMRGHMKTHSGNFTHNCFICNKNFSTKWNLKQHKFVHQNRSTKPHKCMICPSAFMRLQDYDNHMNAHKKIYSFVCNDCGRKFIRKYNYLRHVKEHIQDKKHQCTVAGCPKVFHRKYYLTEHLRTHTGVRPYVCTICSKTSSTKSNHNKHMKIHHASSRDSINVEN